MNNIVRGTNAVIKFVITDENINLANMTACELYIKNGDQTIIKPITDLTINANEKTILYNFTQEETLSFKVNIPISFTLIALIDNIRRQSKTITTKVEDTPKEGVLE